MKKLTILAAVAGVLVTGCAVYDAPVTEGGAYYSTPTYGPYYSYNRGPYYTYQTYPYYYSDRDGDGVADRYDRRPNNPYRR
jgi:hypothetical protein